MSYHEKRSILNLLTAIVVSVSFALYMWPSYPSGGAYAPELFQFWGRFFIGLVLVRIVVQILIHILFAIVNAIAAREEVPAIEDERDKLIELKGNLRSMYIFMLGFILAMLALAFNQPPLVMFLTLFGAGFVAEIVGELSTFYFYRRGV